MRAFSTSVSVHFTFTKVDIKWTEKFLFVKLARQPPGIGLRRTSSYARGSASAQKQVATVTAPNRPHRRMLPLASHLEYIDRRECPNMSPKCPFQWSLFTIPAMLLVWNLSCCGWQNWLCTMRPRFEGSSATMIRCMRCISQGTVVTFSGLADRIKNRYAIFSGNNAKTLR